MSGLSRSPNVLVSTQFLAPGLGGICAVARMTTTALSRHYGVRALACQDAADHSIGSTPVRAFANNRPRFVLANTIEARRATHVLYDFAGTARAHFSRRPYAVWAHGWEVWQAAPATYLRSIARADLILVNSAYTLRRAGKAIPSHLDVRLCPLATSQADPPAIVGPSEGPPTVLLLGRMDEMRAKGHDILIDIWPDVVSAVPDAKLLFVGGGNGLGGLRDLAAASPARHAIDVAGFVADEHIEAHWRRATVFAMPSFSEGFGLTYIEAMRHGLPVIASTEDAGQEVNEDGVTGFNVARADRKRLTEILVTLLRDRDRAKSMGAAGFERWRANFTFQAFEQRLLAATRDFLSAGT